MEDENNSHGNIHRRITSCCGEYLSSDSELKSDTSKLRLTEPVTWKFEKCSMKLTSGGMT